ncbi:MAG: hypothetical protein IKM31_02590 [Oscillospiraceae bacterium]|nr:hypothetical protein [Oscillospiraceae bacterium]
MFKIIDVSCSSGQVKFSPETKDGISFCTLSAACADGFDPDCAVRLTLMPEKEITAWMGIELYSAFWSRPRFGKDFSELPALQIAEGFGGKPAGLQALLCRFADGKYGFLLPLCKGGYVTSLEGQNGFLCSVTRSNCSGVKECETIPFVAAEGDDPYALAEKCAGAAAELLGNGLKVRTERKYPEVFEYLGWCSWDAMEIWVNEEEILEKCAEFREKNIPVRWAILDDMWADIAWTKELPKFTDHSISFGVMHSSPMRDYEADPVRFPNGLKGCIGKMKERFGLKAGVWHPTCGYWQGLEPGSAAAEKLADYTVTVKDGSIMPDLTDPGKSYGFYSTMHAFFKDCGADFLKIDNQSFIRRRYRDMIPAGTAAENLYAGIEPSVAKYFDGDLINCMGMAAENMFSRKTSAISRCSDDFQPENRAWFAKHLLQCAYNGMVQGQFCYNDWDMWWSDDEQGPKNSILRALSGGPIYVSDRIGRSRPEVFRPLCFSDGRILRPDRAALPTADCLLSDMTVEEKPMKVMNIAGKAGYIAAFDLHTDGTSVAGSVSPAEIPGLNGESFVLYEHFSGEYRVMAKDDLFAFTLKDADDYRLFSFTPIENGIAVIGDASKFIGAKAVTASAPGSVTLYEGGMLKIWSETPITSAEDESGALAVERNSDLYTVRTEMGGVITFR